LDIAAATSCKHELPRSRFSAWHPAIVNSYDVVWLNAITDTISICNDNGNTYINPKPNTDSNIAM